MKCSSQAYCNILAGSCMAMGLRFAGSANNDAFETLFYYATHFISLLNKSVAELAGKSTVESCINVVVIALAMVGLKLSNFVDLFTKSLNIFR